MIERIVVTGYRRFRTFDMTPRAGMNIVVGDNASGKSTLLEVITLALTGRLNGHWIGDELHPYLFNRHVVNEFFKEVRQKKKPAKPEILIEIYFTNNDNQLQHLRGKINSLKIDCPGLVLHIAPSPDFAPEFEEYLNDSSCPDILPTEFYSPEWRSFADRQLSRKPKGLGHASIDSRTIKSGAGVDYHTQQLLTDFIEIKERASISVAHRKARHEISSGVLQTVNARIAADAADLFDGAVGLQMDMSAKSSWELDLVPQVSDIPFAMAGQGEQAAIKVALAMHRTVDSTRFVLAEEPENHMSHTSLTKLVDRVGKLAADRQLFVTTHSSFVLNRLGLDALTLLYQGRPATFDDLPADTVQYFRRLSGYDTLRIVLAETVVLVEGPSDEIVFARAFQDRFNAAPMARGVDIISMEGVALKRGLQLCAALGRKVAALRDNDGKAPDHWRKSLELYLESNQRAVFIGEPDLGRTLEPQLITANEEATLRNACGCPPDADLADWMEDHKTEAAVAIADSDVTLTYPPYFTEALEFLQ